MPSIDVTQLEAVFKSYYEKYEKTVYARSLKRLSRYHVPDKVAQAQDFLQDTFEGLFRWLKKYVEENHQLPSSESVERVLFTIELNGYMKYYNKHLKSKVAMEPYPQSSLSADSEPAFSREPPGPEHQRPDRQLLRKEQLTQVVSCIEKELTLTQRTALLLHVYGWSHRDIAAMIGENVETVTHSIIPLARRKLRHLLGASGYGAR